MVDHSVLNSRKQPFAKSINFCFPSSPLDGLSPTFGDGSQHLPPGSLSSMRSRTFLENAINWRPIVKKYRGLKEAPKEVITERRGSEFEPLINPLAAGERRPSNLNERRPSNVLELQ